MTIGIDISSLIYQRGVSRYTRNLVSALMQYTKENLVLLGYSFRQANMLSQHVSELLSDHPNHTAVIKKIPPRIMEIAWEIGQLPLKSILPPIDIFHSWDWLQPPDTTIPLVSTIHDVAILKYPEIAHPKVLQQHKRSWQSLMKRQAHIIAVSQATRRDLIERIGYPSYLIHVVPEALPTEFLEVSNSVTEEIQQSIISQHALERPYLLFVGTREPRKNLDRLIEAWQPMSQEIDLLVVGAQGWDNTSKMEQTNPHLRFLGFVNDTVLSVLYAQAEAFVYPSLDEGFGLPILEAFHHGTPVVTSKSGGTLEVAGNAATLVDPLEVESIRQGIAIVLNETIEEQRKRLQRMIVRQHMFNWQKVAQETRAVYATAIQDQNG